MIELLVIGATLTIAAWATGADAHRRSSASRALDRYARSRGLVFAPAAERRGASPRVLCAKDKLEYVVDLYRLGGEMRTRVTANVPRGRAPIVSVSQQRAFSIRRRVTLRLDEPEFDDAYIVTTGTAEDTEALRQVMRSLLLLDDLRTGVWLRSNGLKVSLSWMGMESDPLVLDAARDAVVTLGAWHRAESPYR